VTVADEAIIARILDGDREAYAILVERHTDRLMRYAVHMLGERADAEEAVQDTFVRGYRSLARCTDRTRFASWLFRILVNRCRTAAARRMRRHRTAQMGAWEQGAPVARPEDEDGAWREEIARALALLSADQREAFLLKYVEDLSYEEMSVLLGVRVSALKMRVKRACAGLREELEGVYRA
jgi:RNA polymerase sigma-70 factor (ECF subfamily)